MTIKYVLVAVLSLIFVVSAGAQTLTIYTENNPPGSYLDAGGPAGMAVEIVREILRRLKQPDTIQVVPWARGYNLAMTRKDVALFSTTRLPQRENLFQWVGPIYTQTWGFYGRKEAAPHIDSMETARTIGRIGTYHNDAKEQFLLKNGFSNIISANDNIINVQRLLQGDIDAWVSSDLNMSHIVKQAGEDPSRIVLVHPFREVENYIAFSIQTDTDIIASWQRTLEAMKQDGSYDNIRHK